MPFGQLWAGNVYGTNSGKVFVKLTGNDDALQGTLSLNELGVGVIVFDVTATFDGTELKLNGHPVKYPEGGQVSNLVAAGKLTGNGQLRGEWQTEAGSSGTFVLYPHDVIEEKAREVDEAPYQVHTARHNFTAVALDRNQLFGLADALQAEFTLSQVVVTVSLDTQRILLLDRFKKESFGKERAVYLKLYVQERESNGFSRIAVIEIGPEFNFASVQGSDEAWVLGMLEKIKRQVQPFERNYTTNFQKVGFGINQILIVGAIVYLPSLETLRDRTLLMGWVLLSVFIVNRLHQKLLPHATLYLVPKPKSTFTASLISWIIAVSSALVAALLAAYLQGQFPFLQSSK